MGGEFLNRVGGERISARQFDELIGLARGIGADGMLNQSEVEFLQKWLNGFDNRNDGRLSRGGRSR
jgi:hypothetical protein